MRLIIHYYFILSLFLIQFSIFPQTNIIELRDFFFQEISRIYVFGDSFSDTGNLFQASNQTLVTSPYFEGRTTNGKIWIEYLAEHLHVGLESYAFGSACMTRKHHSTHNNYILSFKEQISSFLHSKHDSLDEKALYALLIGANDVLYYFHNRKSLNFEQFKNDFILSLKFSFMKIYQSGGRNFLILSIPDISLTPLAHLIFKEPNTFHTFISEINSSIYNLTNILNNEYSDINIAHYNPNSYQENFKNKQNRQGIFQEIYTHPKEYGFAQTNTIKEQPVPCYWKLQDRLLKPNICTEPNTFLFFDFVHPTTKVHCWIANDIAHFLFPENKFYFSCASL